VPTLLGTFYFSVRSTPAMRLLLWWASSLLLASASRPQEGLPHDDYAKMIKELARVKAENAALQQDNNDLEDKSFHMYKLSHGLAVHDHNQEPSSLMQAAHYPAQGGGFPGYSGYMPVSDYGTAPGFGAGLAPAFFGPPSAAAMQEQSLLQNSAVGFNSAGMAQAHHANYASAGRHEHFDAFLTHMETRQRDEDIEKALKTLKVALGDGTGNGKLPEDMNQAVQSAESVHEGVGEWEGVSKQTMEAAPAMARAVAAAASDLGEEHENIARKVYQHGQESLAKFQEED